MLLDEGDTKLHSIIDEIEHGFAGRPVQIRIYDYEDSHSSQVKDCMTLIDVEQFSNDATMTYTETFSLSKDK